MEVRLKVIEEQKALHEKIIALDNFIQGVSTLETPFNLLSHHDQMLLHIQLSTMRAYATVLDQRLIHMQPNTV